MIQAKETHLLGAAIGTMGLFGGWVLAGSAPGGTPLSETANHMMNQWVHSIQTATVAFQNIGLSPDSASLTAAVVGVLAPVAVGIALSNSGRMAIEISKKGFKQFWQDVTGQTRDAELRYKIEDVYGKVDAVFGQKPGLISGGGFVVRTQNGAFHEVDKKTYDAFRRDILSDKAAVIIKGDNILNYADGKLASMVSGLRSSFGFVDRCEIVVKDAETKVETRTLLSDYIADKVVPQQKTYPWPVVRNAPIRFSIASHAKQGVVYVMEGAGAYDYLAKRLGFTQDPESGQWQRSRSEPFSVEQLQSTTPELDIGVEQITAADLKYDETRDKRLVQEAFDHADQTPVTPLREEEQFSQMTSAVAGV